MKVLLQKYFFKQAKKKKKKPVETFQHRHTLFLFYSNIHVYSNHDYIATQFWALHTNTRNTRFILKKYPAMLNRYSNQ